mmetsp:Transcript_45686/g.145532  ORF Transcript_45686/g.145532 Transcript_45686/m.145532 type:complete len:102 (-) Transcript_45686:193-498(-)
MSYFILVYASKLHANFGGSKARDWMLTWLFFLLLKLIFVDLFYGMGRAVKQELVAFFSEKVNHLIDPFLFWEAFSGEPTARDVVGGEGDDGPDVDVDAEEG